MGLRQRIGVGRRGPGADDFGNAKIARQRIHLGLVQMRNRLEVGGAVTLFDEESLVILEPIGRAGDGIIQPIGMIVLDRLAHALLEVGSGDQLEIGSDRQPGGVQGAGWGADGQLENIEAFPLA